MKLIALLLQLLPLLLLSLLAMPTAAGPPPPSPCPSAFFPYPNITTEDDSGIPYLTGPCHTGHGTEGRNIILFTYVLNDLTWGAAPTGGQRVETAIVVLLTWLQQWGFSEILATTKLGNMLSRVPREDGTYAVPANKLQADALRCLYDGGPEFLDQYRATAHVTAMNDNDCTGGPECNKWHKPLMATDAINSHADRVP